MATTSPLANSRSRYSALFGAFSGDTVQRHIDSFGLGRRIFQVTAFVGDMQQVGIHRIRRAALLVLHVDFDAVLLGIGHQLFAGHQIPLAPRGDDLDARLQRVGTELEANLVVALAGRAMADGIGTGFIDDLDQALGDQRTGDGGAQQVLAFRRYWRGTSGTRSRGRTLRADRRCRCSSA
jgi:hypothetical protein